MQFKSITSHPTYQEQIIPFLFAMAFKYMKTLSTSFCCLLFFSLNNSSSFSLPVFCPFLLPPALSPAGSHTSWAMVHKTSPSTGVLPILHRAHGLLPTHTSSWDVYFAMKTHSWLIFSLWLTVDSRFFPGRLHFHQLFLFLNLCNFFIPAEV